MLVLGSAEAPNCASGTSLVDGCSGGCAPMGLISGCSAAIAPMFIRVVGMFPSGGFALTACRRDFDSAVASTSSLLI